jgi:hypothetical protein
MLFEKLLDIISKFIPSDPLVGVERALARLNPDKFDVENVRSILGVSEVSAKRICETAVRQGVLEKRIEVLCPDGAVAASADSEANLPATVNCLQEQDGDFEEVELPTSQLRKLPFYRLNERRSAQRRTA